MLIDLQYMIDKFDMVIEGVVHVGAHLGEEALIYHNAGVERVVWIEGNSDLIDRLKNEVKQYDHRVIEAVVAEAPREVVLNIANETMCSSLFPLGNQAIFAPETEYVRQHKAMAVTLDELLSDRGFLHSGFNFINLDLQGGELLALQGATEYLEDVAYIYTEVNTEYTYLDEPLIPELDSFLWRNGFLRVETSMTEDGWGDALYLRR